MAVQTASARISASSPVAEERASSGFFPVLTFTAVGLLLSVALLFSGLLTAPIESW